ncbi:MAG: hypothetical protein N3E52_05175 [Candidatus Bathyarchaeota archaeon]|nr:hypothetical protein [Candidatus Bathyarchaeota archaeon]
MVEHNVDLEIEEAYALLKVLLLHNNCKVIAEKMPSAITVQHGSLWGISPKTAKKIVRFSLSQTDSGTRISYSSSLASDWKNLTLIGSALAVVVAVFCWWLSTDLATFIDRQGHSYWSWIGTINGYVDYSALRMFRNLALALAVFLVVIIVLEAVVTVYVNLRVGVFAEESLKELRERSLK